MARRMEACSTGGSDTSDPSEVILLIGQPNETITLNIEMDAVERLEKANPLAIAFGVYQAIFAQDATLPHRSLGEVSNANNKMTINDVLMTGYKP
jgi:hypothetical protein